MNRSQWYPSFDLIVKISLILGFLFFFSSIFWALLNRLICTFQSSILRWCFWSLTALIDTWQITTCRALPSFFLIYFVKFTYQGNFQTFIKWSSKQLINLVLIIFFIELLLAKKISLLRWKKTSLVTFIHNLHYWLQNIALGDIFI